jgi:hypothetical protein
MRFYTLLAPGDTNFYLGSLSYFNPAAASDDWFTFGPVAIPSTGANLKWQFKLGDNDYRDGYSVKISTVGSSVANLNAGATLYSVADNAPSTAGDTIWTNKSVGLTSGIYGGQSVFIGFHHAANDMDLLFLDNIIVESCTSVPTQSIEDHFAQISLFPNPTTSLIKIEGLQAGTIIAVTDLTGRSLGGFIREDNGEANLNLEKLSNGFYFVNLIYGGKTRAVKIQVIK